ncbi:MAG: iron complex outermembrane receptor protein [Candidatus Latescibacterota bacterium]
MIAIYVLVLLALSSLPVLAQIDSVRYQLPATLVNATRAERPAIDLPYALSVIEIDSSVTTGTALSLEDVLRGVPGILVDNRHNLSQGDRLSARGLGVRAAFGVRGLKVVLDGIPLTTADGQTQLNNLDLGSMARIEILRGPSSALYGNASGGLLSISTRKAATEPLRFQPRFLMGSDGLLRLQARLSGSSGQHRYFLNAQGLQSDGYRDHAYGETRNLNALSHHALSDRLELSLLFNAFDAPYLFNPSSLDRETAATKPQSARFFVVSQGSSKKVRQVQGGASLSYRHDANTTSQIVLYGLDRSLTNPIPGRIIELDRSGGGLRATHSGTWRSLRYIGGIDGDWQSDQRDEFANEGLADEYIGTLDNASVFARIQYGNHQLDQREKVRSMGPFLALDIPLHSDLTLNLSGRYDNYRFDAEDHITTDGDDSGSRSLGQFSPLIGLNYQPHPLLSFYANYATAFQTPTTTELSNRVDGLGGFNPDLEPEHIRSAEFGARMRHPRWPLDAELSLYQLDISDMLIAFQVAAPESEEIYFRNAGEAQNRGAELALSATPSARISAQLAYTYSHFIFVDYPLNSNQLSDNEVPGLPPHHLFAELRFSPRKEFYAHLSTEWLSDYFANDYNGPAPGTDAPRANFINDGYMRTDLSLGWRPSHWQVFVGINNIFDVSYNGSIVPNAFGNRFFEPAAGRTTYAGVEFDLTWKN